MASCKSWDGTIIDITGVNTTTAKMSGVVTREDVLEYCSRMADISDQKRLSECLKEPFQQGDGLSLTVTADCKATRIKPTDEKEYQLLGSKDDSGSPAWQHVRSGKILDGSCASGAPPITGQFAILCPKIAGNLSTPAATLVSLESLEGNWHSGDAKVCKGEPGNTEGLMSFRKGQLIAYESTCKIIGSKASGQFLAVRMICYFEGMQARDSTVFEFLNDQKIRRAHRERGKIYSVTSTRCPTSP